MTPQERSRNSGLKRYGITLAQLKAMYEDQRGCCAICDKPVPLMGGQGKPKGIHVDHCHKTGLLRKLLCNRCNLGLAYLEDKLWVEKAGIYMLKFEGKILSIQTNTRGAGTVFRQKGSRFWWIQYYRRGKRIRESSGCTERAMAEQLLRSRLNLVRLMPREEPAAPAA